MVGSNNKQNLRFRFGFAQTDNVSRAYSRRTMPRRVGLPP